MEVAADTAVVMATHDGARFLASQIESILAQSLLPAVVVIVDDASRDGSTDLIREVARTSPIPFEMVAAAGSGVTDPKSRITASHHARNDCGRVIRVHPPLRSGRRVASGPTDAPARHPARDTSALLVAGDGLLIDESGAEIGGSLRDRFPPPEDWDASSPADRVRASIRRPFVTGATCAIRRELIRMMAPVPRSWLFDRWATLVATARDGLVLQPETVIRYRIHPDQLLGDRQATVPVGIRRWRQVLARGASPLEAAMRARDVVGRIRPLAIDATIRDELSWRALFMAAMERTDPPLRGTS